MFAEVLIVSLVVGFILKGKLSNLKNVDISHIELVFIAYALETALVLLIRNDILHNQIIKYALHLLMYIILLVFVYLNKKFYEVLIIGSGFLLNMIAIFFNGGVMPVSEAVAVKMGLGDIIKNISSYGLYKLVDGNTVFAFLCDVIPRPYPRPLVISIGDIVIAVGLFLLVLKLMGNKNIFKLRTSHSKPL